MEFHIEVLMKFCFLPYRRKQKIWGNSNKSTNSSIPTENKNQSTSKVRKHFNFHFISTKESLINRLLLLQTKHLEKEKFDISYSDF